MKPEATIISLFIGFLLLDCWQAFESVIMGRLDDDNRLNIYLITLIAQSTKMINRLQRYEYFLANLCFVNERIRTESDSVK